MNLKRTIENADDLNSQLILFFSVVKRIFQHNFSFFNNSNKILDIISRSEFQNEKQSIVDLINLAKMNLSNVNEIMSKYYEVVKIKNNSNPLFKFDEEEKNFEKKLELTSQYVLDKEKEIKILNYENIHNFSEDVLVSLFEKIEEISINKEKKIQNLTDDLYTLKSNFLNEKEKLNKFIDNRENEIFTLENKVEKLNNEIKFLIDQINSLNTYIDSNKNDIINDGKIENTKNKVDKGCKFRYVYLTDPKEENLIYHNKIEFGKSILNNYKMIIKDFKKNNAKRHFKKDKVMRNKKNVEICEVKVNELNLFNINSLNQTEIMNIDLIDKSTDNQVKKSKMNFLRLSKINQERSKSRKPIKKLDLLNNSLVRKNQIKVELKLK